MRWNYICLFMFLWCAHRAGEQLWNALFDFFLEAIVSRSRFDLSVYPGCQNDSYLNVFAHPSNVLIVHLSLQHVTHLDQFVPELQKLPLNRLTQELRPERRILENVCGALETMGVRQVVWLRISWKSMWNRASLVFDFGWFWDFVI